MAVRYRIDPTVIMVAVLSAVLLAIEFAFTADDPGLEVATVLPLAAAALYVLAGMIAWSMRPHNRIGLLLVLTGLSMWLAGLVVLPVPALQSVGLLAQTLPLAATLHLLLAFPSGRVEGRFARILVVTGYAASTVLQVPQFLFGEGQLAIRPDGAGRLVDISIWVQMIIGVFSVLAAAALVAVRAYRADSIERRHLGPMIWYRIIGPTALGVSAVVVRVTDDPDVVDACSLVQTLAVLGLPVAFLVGLLFGSFGRAGEVDEIVARIGTTTPSPTELNAAVAGALGDPEARVVYARGADGFVDDAGEDVPIDTGNVRLHPVHHDGRVVGAIVHRRGLAAGDSLVDVLGGIVAMAIDQQRLAAVQRALVTDLRAREVDLRRSRRRLLRAEDSERRRIARDLHDGAQQHIVVLGLEARQLSRRAADTTTATTAGAIADGLTGLLAEFRDLIAGIMPAPLVDRGLGPAIELLAERMPIPTAVRIGSIPSELPAEAESTIYFLVSESLTNIIKHAGAESALVTLDTIDDPADRRFTVIITDDGNGGARTGGGTGLGGLAERIATLGGTLAVESSAGTGSTVRAEIPCG